MAAVAALPLLAQVAMATSVASTALAGYSAYTTNRTQEKQAKADAEAAQGAGRVEAARIRDNVAKQQSSARAAAAENGLSIGDGTAVTINDKIEQGGQYDAAMAEISGFNSSQRLRAEAKTYRNQANMAAASTALNMASNGLNTYKGWK
ncbi:hypothetical protein ACUXVT_04660 [Acinetobacter soli]|uniref:hypothetical protein n=1 Tax=Acinetobacter soli TaxID=487316 RepID=UPI004056B705